MTGAACALATWVKLPNVRARAIINVRVDSFFMVIPPTFLSCTYYGLIGQPFQGISVPESSKFNASAHMHLHLSEVYCRNHNLTLCARRGCPLPVGLAKYAT